MALGTTQVGANVVLSVSTTVGGTYSPISDLNSFGKSSNRTINQFPVLQRSTAYGIPAPREESFTAGGYLSIGDTGQDLLRAAEAANTTVFLKVLFDGTNGFTQEVRVGSKTYNVAPDGLQEVTFEFSAVGVAAIVGTGPIL